MIRGVTLLAARVGPHFCTSVKVGGTSFTLWVLFATYFRTFLFPPIRNADVKLQAAAGRARPPPVSSTW
jgi:hypothetical protein